MRRNILILMMMTALISCRALKHDETPRMTIYYDMPSVYSRVFPNYYTFRNAPRTFEYYSYFHGESVLGTWHQKGDTLIICPKFFEHGEDSFSKTKSVTRKDSTRLLIVNDTLYDLNDWTLKTNYDLDVDYLFDTTFRQYIKISIISRQMSSGLKQEKMTNLGPLIIYVSKDKQNNILKTMYIHSSRKDYRMFITQDSSMYFGECRFVKESIFSGYYQIQFFQKYRYVYGADSCQNRIDTASFEFTLDIDLKRKAFINKETNERFYRISNGTK